MDHRHDRQVPGGGPFEGADGGAGGGGGETEGPPPPPDPDPGGAGGQAGGGSSTLGEQPQHRLGRGSSGGGVAEEGEGARHLHLTSRARQDPAGGVPGPAPPERDDPPEVPESEEERPQPSSPVVDYNSGAVFELPQKIFKEFTVYGETEDQDSHTLRRWASKGPGLARHYLHVQLQPEEVASPLPTTFSCNNNAALEAGTPANGQALFQQLDDWEFPALLPTPKKSAKAPTRYPLHLDKPYESKWCTECEHNSVCFGKRQGYDRGISSSKSCP